ncbi:MAG: tetratricopeptide repeat protein [Desulforhopalus sp.]
MSSKVQSLDAIGPMEETLGKESKDSVAKEYEEGKKLLENQEYGQAAVALHNALIGFEEKNDDNGIANASNQLGHLCLARNDFENALKHYQKALEICDGANDRMSALAVLKKIVAAHRGLQQLDRAITTSLEILDHYYDNRDPQGSVTILEEMAEIYLEDGNRGKAADAYRTISSIHKNFRHDNLAAKYLNKANELEDRS